MATLELLSDYEIERGKPMPSKNHSYIQSNLIIALAGYRKKFDFLSEISLELNEWQSTPDIGIFPKLNIDFRHDEIRMTEPPLCAIEIISPSQSIQELADKAQQYLDAGVQSVWLVIPPIQTVVVYQKDGSYESFSKASFTDPSLDITLDLNSVFMTS